MAKLVNAIEMTESELFIISIVMTHFQSEYCDCDKQELNKVFTDNFKSALDKVNSGLTHGQVECIKAAFSEFHIEDSTEYYKEAPIVPKRVPRNSGRYPWNKKS